MGKLNNEIDLTITIIGDASPGSTRGQMEKEKILATVNKYNLESKVRLLGYQPHKIMMQEAYNNHVFLSPSVTASDGDTEGGAPVSIIELAASGMPVVSTNHCDIPEIIDDGRTGLLTNERDVDGLVGKLKWLINNPGKWRQITDDARHHIDKEFNAQIQGQRLLKIYQDVLDA